MKCCVFLCCREPWVLVCCCLVLYVISLLLLLLVLVQRQLVTDSRWIHELWVVCDQVNLLLHESDAILLFLFFSTNQLCRVFVWHVSVVRMLVLAISTEFLSM